MKLDPLHLVSRLGLPVLARCRVPRELEAVTSIGEEEEADTNDEALSRVWRSVEALYRTGVYPAVQLCVHRHGARVLDRSLGHARGNAPDDPADGSSVLASVETPFNIFSAAKAITAMVIHSLDEQNILHLDDRVCDYIPEFGRHGKDRITIRHILAHRSGIPNLPPEAFDLDLLGKPARVTEIMCDAKPQTRPGRLLAYHAVSGGFVLGELVQRAAGDTIRAVLEAEICQKLGFRWMNYGVCPEDIDQVAVNAFTGPPPPPPVSSLLRRALGVDMRQVIELSNDRRFLEGIIPSANIVTTASELATFYQCLLNGGELGGVRVFDPRTVRHATSEQSYWEIDLTLGLPLRYGLGFMLGDERVSLYGRDNPHAFGHLGFTNVFSWADPERELVVVLLTSGKPILSLHAIRLLQFLGEVERAFPKVRTASDRRLWQARPPRGSSAERASRSERTAGRRVQTTRPDRR